VPLSPALVVLDQHEAAQFGPEMPADLSRQWRRYRLPMG